MYEESRRRAVAGLFDVGRALRTSGFALTFAFSVWRVPTLVRMLATFVMMRMRTGWFPRVYMRIGILSGLMLARAASVRLRCDGRLASE